MFSCFNYIFKKKINEQHLNISEEYTNFNLNNVKGKFYVHSVYDGDTVTLLVPIKISVYDMIDEKNINPNSNTNPSNQIILNKINVRLYGIDTPELKPTKNILDRDKHIIKAKEARDYLSELILNKVILVEFLSNDKYGRPLVKLFTDNNVCLNNLMIKKGYAKEYNGGTKNEIFEDVIF